MQLLEQAHGVVDHVGLLCELILGLLDLLGREELVLDEVGEERKDEMSVAMGNNCSRQVVFRHFGRRRRRRSSKLWWPD